MIKSDPKDLVVRRQVRRVQLSLYSDEDVRARSVVEITSPQAYLNEQTPLPGGLYDPKLGCVSANDPLPCPTCAGRFLTCPGHFGHIECCVPLYQPLLWAELLKVLRCKCYNCHRLKPAKRSLLLAHAKILLLQHNRLEDYHNLDANLAILIKNVANPDPAGGDDPNVNPALKSSKAQKTREAGKAMDDALQEIIDELEQKPLPEQTSTYQTSLLRTFRADLIRLWKATPKCRHCGAFSPRVKSDQSNKIFLTELSNTQSRINESNDIRIQSALETLASQENQPVEKQEDGYDSEDTDVGSDSQDQAKKKKKKKSKSNRYIDDEAVEVDDAEAEAEKTEDMQVDVDDDDEDPDNLKGVTSNSEKNSASQKYMHSKEVQAQCQLTWKYHGELLCRVILGGTSFGNPKTSYKALFVQAIAVPPSRFRPPMVMGGMTVEHAQNHYLSKIITENAQVRQELLVNKNERLAHTFWIQLQTTLNCFMDSSKDPSAYSANAPIGIRQLLEKKEGIFRKHMMGKRVDSACRSVISPDPYIGTNEIGIPMAFARVLTYPTPVTEWNVTEMRRLVERGPDKYPGARWVEVYKEGRSVRVDLTKMSDERRIAVASTLLQQTQNGNRPVLVGRQLRHGDTMLVNRQPTLHKPGIMAHQVRILHDPNQKTIRMHYANCNTYNADYDGDEMNCHFPQSDVARAEAVHIASTDLQYIVPTDGSPLRGLIQDHVCGGVKLTMRDTFLKRWEYQQLLFTTLASLPGLEILESNQDIQLVPPAILKPEPLWTGKQVITTLLLHLCNSPRGRMHVAKNDNSNMLNQGGISMERKSKMPETAFGAVHEEHLVLIRDGELLRGVLDKAAFGATDFSLVHGVYEVYGPTKAGLLLNSLGRLFTAYIQYYAGHSCRVEDLVLTPETDKLRRDLVQRAYNIGSRACKAWADSEGGKVAIESVAEKEGSNRPLKPVEFASASAKIGQLLGGAQGKENFAQLDGYMMSQLNPLASEIVKKSLPKGLAVPFPANTFGLMTTTGAKGSIVNQSQVSCALGQQALEGRRVPRLNSGRTLPSFAPYDLNPRADGFVMDRFLTGVRPQEYYFHCMAGREGLVDTAVKTSRSGYLQRCLVKHLEELKVCYDYTVRNGEGGVVQFLYGEDALDPTKATFLDCSTRSFEFMARNHKALLLQNAALPGSTIDMAAEDHERHESLESGDHAKLFQPGGLVLARRLREGNEWVRGALCQGWHEAIVKKFHPAGQKVDIEYTKDRHRVKRVPLSIDLGRCGGTSERAVSSHCILVKPAAADPIVSAAAGSVLKTRREGGSHCLGSTGGCVSERVASAAAKALATNQLETAMKACHLSRADVGRLVAVKFASALCAPGEAVGCIAAQSVGEPSTQMTLNTFHLAGAGANVTLGIPRLREIIMTASKTLKTPTMSMPLRESLTEASATRLARSFTKLSLMELIAGYRGVTVRETLMTGEDGSWERAYFIVLKLHPAERISAAFGLSLKDVAECVGLHMVPELARLMKIELKRSATEGDINVMKVVGSQSTNQVKESRGEDDMEAENDDNQSPSKQPTDKDDLTDEEDNASGDEGGEEDGVAASKYNRSEDRDASYGMGDDGEDASGDGESGQPDFEMSTVDSPAITTDVNNTLHSAPAAGEVKVDKRTNSIILAPLRVDPSTRPLLMVGLVERAAERVLIRSRKNIDQAFVNKEEGRGRCLQTAGVNFHEFWSLDSTVVDHSGLMSNDTWAIRCAYGVEAARSNIVEQIRSVFGAYGIEVNPRHLTLIADYMTYEGGYKAMNRIGMEEMSSTLLQMSFETTAHFLTQAALSNARDELESPSANIVLGRPIRQGTGAFDILVK